MSRRDRSLPIFEIEPALVRAASRPEGVRVVIEAPTGSGKSTQVPQMLRDSGARGERGEIVVLQPRRLAARMLARRVAWERGVPLGGEVGCQVRFENQTGRDTRIRYVTEGVLLRQLLTDPELTGVAAVVFDEFHERHFYGDVTLARCVETQEALRPDLKLVVMSATLETDPLRAYLGEECEFLVSEGRTFPVEIRHCPPKERHGDALWDHIARVLQAYFREKGGVEGHTLVFLPGTHEIRKTVDALQRANWTRGFEVCPLYGELSTQAQDAAVAPSATPKIVVATNVAETSITIDGVRVVVDSGLERRSDFDVRRGISTLTIEKISRASADQRAGRAGRTAPGVCLRLWSENDHAGRAAATPAEIHRMDLSEAVLLLKAGGIADARGFRWFEAPDAAALDRAHEWLKTLGAIDPETEAITPLGRELSRVPLAPRHARVLLEAGEHGCLEFFAVAAAATQTRPLFPNQKRKASHLELADFAEPSDGSDFQALFRAWSAAKRANYDFDVCGNMGLNVAAAREIGKIAKQFVDLVGPRCESPDQDAEPDGETIGRILLAGFSDSLCLRLSDATLACAVVGGRRGLLGKDSIAAKHTRLFLAGEIVEIEGKDVNVRLSLATRLDEAWLREEFPDDFHEQAAAQWEESGRRVVARVERRFRDLVLESRESGKPPGDEAAAILAEQVAGGNLTLKRWDTAVEQWIARVNTLANAYPEYEVPAIGPEERLLLLTEICRGAASFKDIKERDPWRELRQWLPPHLALLLDRLVPERIDLQSGRSVKVIYSPLAGEKPKIAVMIQHLFGIGETPRLPEGRVPLVVEILAPNGRPCQTTEDLAGFWAGSYAGVRAQLRGRYPKHA
ncbi:MAG: ATP-dependent helicase HrpB, partial [Verrucomicrobiae bacterium]|nr:ATP-dependent helicase HrpB [Verrucomicrobiae bacterium]